MPVSLPTELLIDILTFALPLHPGPADILRTSSQIFTLAFHILYTHLRFTSTRQLALFLSTFEDHSLRCAPRSIDCDIDVENNATSDVFQLMCSLFTRCSAVPTAEVDDEGRLVVDLLRLRMNSHAQDPNIYMVYEALSQINPRRFTWVGPAPPHHFSIAIVPQAVPPLFRALSGHSNLVELKLTHIGFPSPKSDPESDPFELVPPHIPSLRVFYLGQATFVSPYTIASFIGAVQSSPNNLQTVRLVDVYKGSIWGLRLRLSDVEEAAMMLALLSLRPEGLLHRKELVIAALEMVRRVVICEAQTERIIGGDRDEDNTLMVTLLAKLESLDL